MFDRQLFANATAYCVGMTCPDELSSAENLAQVRSNEASLAP